MVNEWSYEELLNEYRQLQLRVTRFSSTEQELINTRDRLDQELELYKRLQFYIGESLKLIDEDSLLQLSAEAIVDMLEVEVSVVYLNHRTNPAASKVFFEGCSEVGTPGELYRQLYILYEANQKNDNGILSSDLLDKSDSFSFLDRAVISYFSEPELDYCVFFLGGVSKKNKSSYNQFQPRHSHIFSIFSHQMQTVLSNQKRNEKIEQQLQQIAKSDQELKKLSLIATKTKSGVIIADTHGRVEWVNDAFTKISGYELNEVIGIKPKDFLHGHDTSEDKKSFLHEALKEQKDLETVIVNHRKDGTPFYNQLEIISVFNEKGEHTNFIAIQKDITEEIQQRNEIVQMNSRFELISNSSNIGIWEWDVNKKREQWNDVLYRIYGMDTSSSSESMFEQWKSMIHPEDKKLVLADLQALIEGKINHVQRDFRVKRKNDDAVRLCQSLTIAEKDEENRLSRLVGSVRDITEIRQLQTNLEDAVSERDASLSQVNEVKAFYERILKNSPTEILVFDKDFRVVFTNQKSTDTHSNWYFPIHTKLEDHSTIGSNESKKIILEKINQVVEQKTLIHLEEEQIDGDQNAIFYLRTILPYFDSDGQLENVIVIGTDITDQKKTQQDVILKNEELQKINLELDQFVYSISHDLRSPLLSIKGIISLVLKSPALQEDHTKFLNMALSSTVRLDNTIQEILDYSRNSRLELGADHFDVIEMAKTVFDDIKFSSAAEIGLEIKNHGNTMVYSDRARMGVLLKNIIGNSIKYSKENSEALVSILFENDGETWKMSIQDNGEGIDAKHLERVFDMFYRGTTNSMGTGLGLYICKEIVHKMNGSISLTSEIGIGTSVTIQFPKNP
jgi:PAS domain S-box-containing protein